MEHRVRHLLRLASTVFGIAVASVSSADPILTLSTDEIELSPTTTEISFEVDPNDTPLSAVVLNFSALASGLAILDVSPADGNAGSGPALEEGFWLGALGASFIIEDRTEPFVVGTLTLEGFVSDTPLVLEGDYTDGNFVTIPIGPMEIAFVIPEPATSALQLAALATIFGLHRSRHRRRVCRVRASR